MALRPTEARKSTLLGADASQHGVQSELTATLGHSANQVGMGLMDDPVRDIGRSGYTGAARRW
jgi:hypothetical protein